MLRWSALKNEIVSKSRMNWPQKLLRKYLRTYDYWIYGHMLLMLIDVLNDMSPF
jgi:hypothetical protein